MIIKFIDFVNEGLTDKMISVPKNDIIDSILTNPDLCAKISDFNEVLSEPMIQYLNRKGVEDIDKYLVLDLKYDTDGGDIYDLMNDILENSPKVKTTEIGTGDDMLTFNCYDDDNITYIYDTHGEVDFYLIHEDILKDKINNL